MSDKQIQIQNVAFRPDGIVEVTYSEPHDMSDHIGLVKLLMFDATIVENELDELGEFLIDLVDTVMVKLRNPPETKPGLRRQ